MLKRITSFWLQVSNIALLPDCLVGVKCPQCWKVLLFSSSLSSTKIIWGVLLLLILFFFKLRSVQIQRSPYAKWPIPATPFTWTGRFQWSLQGEWVMRKETDQSFFLFLHFFVRVLLPLQHFQVNDYAWMFKKNINKQDLNLKFCFT